MHLLKVQRNNLKNVLIFACSPKYYSSKTKLNLPEDLNTSFDRFDKVLNKWRSKVIYNTLISRHDYTKNINRKSKSQLFASYQQEGKELESANPLPITLQLLDNNVTNTSENERPDTCEKNVEPSLLTNFRFEADLTIPPIVTGIIEDSKGHYNAQMQKQVEKKKELQNEMKNWMTAYDNYDDINLEESNQELDLSKVNYGTPDLRSKISRTPCGGCGAHLHCKDTAIPGYIPSEIFKNIHTKGGSNLSAIICQRCYFLKHYNLAIQVQVNAKDYSNVLQTIAQKQGVVILLVDLTDFPCSIWPGIGEIFRNKIPIVIVGNKIDLIPKDSRNYLTHVKQTLLNCVKLNGFTTFNIKHVALISAQTGYGVDDLITSLNTLYSFNGNFYIVGCTNVGKSTLFNRFLCSDFCKSQASDLIQRATTSVWPGTTLNLLKFPIRRPSGYTQYLRHKRLEDQKLLDKEEAKLRRDQLRSSKNPKMATLIGHVDITKNPHTNIDEARDYFDNNTQANASGRVKLGINEKDMTYMYSKWCYDTPGVEQFDQIINLLTTEELLLTLPNRLILPRSFCIKPGSSLFIGGLSRLDYLKGLDSVRLTVFASEQLPITICQLKEADELYLDLLGTPLLKVPKGGTERMKAWPNLEIARTFKVVGEDWKMSVIDVVLSNSGWIAITGNCGLEYKFQAWTPEKRGCYLRDCLLPSVIRLAGHRIKNSVAYNKHNFFLKE